MFRSFLTFVKKIISYFRDLWPRRAAKAARERALNEGKNVMTTTRILSPFLFLGTCIVVIGLVLVSFEMGYLPSSLPDFFLFLFISLNNFIIPSLTAMLLVQLLWGVFLYLIPGLKGNQFARRKGRIYISWAFLIAILLTIIWAIANLFSGPQGLPSDDLPSPIPVVVVSLEE